MHGAKVKILEIVGDEANDIHGRYIIWRTASHFTQIIYRVVGGSGLAGVLLCSVPFSITFYSP